MIRSVNVRNHIGADVVGLGIGDVPVYENPANGVRTGEVYREMVNVLGVTYPELVDKYEWQQQYFERWSDVAVGVLSQRGGGDHISDPCRYGEIGVAPITPRLLGSCRTPYGIRPELVHGYRTTWAVHHDAGDYSYLLGAPGRCYRPDINTDNCRAMVVIAENGINGYDAPVRTYRTKGMIPILPMNGVSLSMMPTRTGDTDVILFGLIFYTFEYAKMCGMFS